MDEESKLSPFYFEFEKTGLFLSFFDLLQYEKQ